MSFKKFGIWGNTEKEIFWKILPEILSWAEKVIKLTNINNETIIRLKPKNSL